MLMLLAAQLLAGVDSGPAVVRGSVRDGETGRPVSGVTVIVGNAPVALTDSSGTYYVRATASGTQRLSARRTGYLERRMRVLLPPSGTLRLDLTLEPLPQRLPLVAVRSSRTQSSDDSGKSVWRADRRVDAQGLSDHPLTIERDVLLSVAGGDVAVRPETPGGISVRGGSSDQVRYAIDGIPVLNPHHVGALIGPWNPDVIAAAALSESAPSLAVPAGLSGALDATTRAAGDALSARGGVSSSQLRVAMDGPIATPGSSFLLSVRAGAPTALAPNDETYLRGASRDWLGTITTSLFGGTLKLLGTGSADDASVSRGATADALPGASVERNALSWSNSSFGARWGRSVATRSAAVSVWRAGSEAEYSWRGDATLRGLESTRRDLGAQATLRLDSRATSTLTGVRLEDIQTRYSSTDSTAQAAAVPTLGLDARTPIATVFVEQSRILTPQWSLGLGGALVSSRRRTAFEPRATLRWMPRSAFSLSITGSRAHQFVQSLRNAESVVSHVAPAELFVGAGDGRVPVATSTMISVEAALRPSEAVSLSLQAFARVMGGLVAASTLTGDPFVSNLRPGRVPEVSGRASGVSAHASWRTPRTVIDVRYGATSVAYQRPGLEYTPEHAVRHQVLGGLSAWLTPATQLRIGGVAAFGRRATPVVGAVEWEACNLLDRGCEFSGVPRSDPAQVGSLALPGYIRTDISLRRSWSVRLAARRAELALFGTLTNVFNRQNVLNFAEVAGERRALELRPVAPLVLGLDWKF